MVSRFLTLKARIVFFRKNGKPPYKRGNKRIRLKIGFSVSGKDEHGFHFKTEAQTINVSGKGCCLCLDKDLERGQILKLMSPKGHPFSAKVCWSRYSPLRDIRYVGVALPLPVVGWIIAN